MTKIDTDFFLAIDSANKHSINKISPSHEPDHYPATKSINLLILFFLLQTIMHILLSFAYL